MEGSNDHEKSITKFTAKSTAKFTWTCGGNIHRFLLQSGISNTPPIARYGVFGVSTWPLGCDTPSPFSERFPSWRAGEVEVRYPPLERGISAIPARYPMKTRQMGAIPPSVILSRKGIARYGGGDLALGR